VTGFCPAVSANGARRSYPASALLFLTAPTDVRLARLRRRETAIFGVDAIGPGGARHKEYEAFIEWATAYDDNTAIGRSRPGHETWLSRLPCPVIRLDGSEPIDILVEKVVAVG